MKFRITDKWIHLRAEQKLTFLSSKKNPYLFKIFNELKCDHESPFTQIQQELPFLKQMHINR